MGRRSSRGPTCERAPIEGSGGPCGQLAAYRLINGRFECEEHARHGIEKLGGRAHTPLPSFPQIVCLCGSTRFWKTYQEVSLIQTLAGYIVLSVGAATASDEEHFGHLAPEEVARIKEALDELHKRKIDLADQVLVLNVDGYIGESTASEIDYALWQMKCVRFLEPAKGEAWMAEHHPTAKAWRGDD